jgi:hypothetical protein
MAMAVAMAMAMAIAHGHGNGHGHGHGHSPWRMASSWYQLATKLQQKLNTWRDDLDT